MDEIRFFIVRRLLSQSSLGLLFLDVVVLLSLRVQSAFLVCFRLQRADGDRPLCVRI